MYLNDVNLRRSIFNNARTQYNTQTNHNFIFSISLSHPVDDSGRPGDLEGANCDNRARAREVRNHDHGYYGRDGSSCVSPARVCTDSSDFRRGGRGEGGAGVVPSAGWEADSRADPIADMPRSAIRPSSRNNFADTSRDTFADTRNGISDDQYSDAYSASHPQGSFRSCPLKRCPFRSWLWNEFIDRYLKQYSRLRLLTARAAVINHPGRSQAARDEATATDASDGNVSTYQWGLVSSMV